MAGLNVQRRSNICGRGDQSFNRDAEEFAGGDCVLGKTVFGELRRRALNCVPCHATKTSEATPSFRIPETTLL
jgi:hypothetical protein